MKNIDIENILYKIWKDGFDSETIEQYDFNDDIVNLTEQVQEIESLCVEMKEAIKHIIEINILRINNGKSQMLGSVAINKMAHLIDDKKAHEIKVKSYGHSEMQYLQNVCTCGWIGRKFYAYEDLQITLCRDERDNHLRILSK